MNTINVVINFLILYLLSNFFLLYSVAAQLPPVTTISLPNVDNRALALEMVLIPSGTFTMGFPENEQGHNKTEEQRVVDIAKSFYMSKYEITQDQWMSIMGYNPSYNNENLSNPVETVTYGECIHFCKKLSKIVGIEAAYDGNNFLIADSNGFRLPHEEEWEYACRSITTTRFYWGEDSSLSMIDNCAWYVNNSGGVSHQVGLKLPNKWDLYDMSGNVWEMCNSFIIRGGSFNSAPSYLQSAFRSEIENNIKNRTIGFRIISHLANLPTPTMTPTFTLTPSNTPTSTNTPTYTSTPFPAPLSEDNVYRVFENSSPKQALFLSNNQDIVILSNENTVEIFNIESGEKKETFTQLSDIADISEIDITPDDSILLTLHDNPENCLKIWDMDSGELLYLIDNYNVSQFDVSHDGSKVLTLHYIKNLIFNYHLNVWNINTAKMLFNFNYVYKSRFNEIGFAEFSQDDSSIFTNDLYDIIQINMNENEIKIILDNAYQNIFDFAISSDEKFMALLRNIRLILYDLENRKIVPLENSRYISFITFSSDSKLFAWADRNKGWYFYCDLFNMEEDYIENLSGIATTCIEFFPKSSILLISSHNQGLILWDIKQNKLIKTIHQISPVNSLTFSPDLNYMMGISNETEDLYIWKNVMTSLLTYNDSTPIPTSKPILNKTIVPSPSPITILPPKSPSGNFVITYKLTEPSVDPNGIQVTYTYEWSSNTGKKIIHGPTLSIEDTLDWRNVETDEIWTIKVTPHGFIDGIPNISKIKIVDSETGITEWLQY